MTFCTIKDEGGSRQWAIAGWIDDTSNTKGYWFGTPLMTRSLAERNAERVSRGLKPLLSRGQRRRRNQKERRTGNNQPVNDEAADANALLLGLQAGNIGGSVLQTAWSASASVHRSLSTCT